MGDCTVCIGKCLADFHKMGKVRNIENTSQRGKPVNEILYWKVGKKLNQIEGYSLVVDSI